MQIWKFPLFEYEEGKVNEIEIPKGAHILHFDYMYNIGNTSKLQLWVLVKSKAGKEKRRFIVVDTGEEIKEIIKSYIGTTIVAGKVVLHCFEVK